MKQEIRTPALTGQRATLAFFGTVANHSGRCRRDSRIDDKAGSNTFRRCVSSIDRRSQRQQLLCWGRLKWRLESTLAQRAGVASLNSGQSNHARIRSLSLIHLPGSGYTGASGDVPLWRRQT